MDSNDIFSEIFNLPTGTTIPCHPFHTKGNRYNNIGNVIELSKEDEYYSIGDKKPCPVCGSSGEYKPFPKIQGKIMIACGIFVFNCDCIDRRRPINPKKNKEKNKRMRFEKAVEEEKKRILKEHAILKWKQEVERGAQEELEDEGVKEQRRF